MFGRAKTKQKYPRIRVPLSERLRDLLRGPLVLLIWLAAGAGAIWLMSQERSQLEYLGLARAMRYQVSAAVQGELLFVSIDEFDSVTRGQVIAEMDSTLLDARIQTTAARIGQLRSELDATRASLEANARALEADQEDLLRRFEVDEADLELRRLALLVEIEADRVRLERENAIYNRLRVVDLKRAGGEREIEEQRLLAEEIRRRIEANTTYLDQATVEMQQARLRRSGFEARLAEAPELEPQLVGIRDSIEVQLLELQGIELTRQNLRITAPVTGRVTEVLARSGQNVLAGDAIASITLEQPGGIVVYVPVNSTAVERPAPHALARVTRLHDDSIVAETVVLEVGTSFERIPEQLWVDPAIPEYGLPVLLASAPALELLPAEPVRVSLIN
jgi:multidrug resistance efflux pump